ncbi:flagellar hook-associated protein FlgK [Gracilibacillus oryzae]|uniref:Flagellar hook-associated protein 1 n=1 Tax=Gracilibacillus oryzae TaxID=1672701 RepID=A0A7C8KYB9_9BACI|nr:flagellar hook-associated protein FlgK [Gracilibacillus oryzae]KAB8139482.1 flagellar hook-associated protein FlgK [Gracilibacillus oryzae]
MGSTFNGLEVAKRALHAQQSALYTTGHNIANANTEGYTRQRVNFVQSSPYPPATRNRPEIPGQVGSGVEAGSIERIRDSFIDKQYRQENTKVGFYEARADMLGKLETILNEPTDQGLSQTMDLFWQSLQDLAVNPEDSGARSVVKERGVAVAEAFQYIEGSLQQVRNNLKGEIGVDNTAVNSLIDQINQLNGQISKIEPHGYVPNDLYDERDRLIDELSAYVDIKVDYRKSSGQPSPIAQGIATITLNADTTIQNSKDAEGNEAPIVLVNGSEDVVLGEDEAVNHLFFDFNDSNNLQGVFFAQPDSSKSVEDQVEDLVASLDVEGNEATFIYGDDFNVPGKLQSLIDGAGYMEGFDYDNPDAAGTSAGKINEILDELDVMVVNFVEEFNAVHNEGYSLDGDTGVDFFEVDPATGDGRTAASISVNQDILDDPDLIAAGIGETDEDGNISGSSGNGENAINLANVYTKLAEDFNIYSDDTADLETTYGISEDAELDGKTSIKSFFESIVGELGVISQESQRMQGNSEILKQQVLESRQAISSVSLDEEMTNLIQYQHAYNAAARNMTVVDEMLDRIINNMGLVGR